MRKYYKPFFVGLGLKLVNKIDAAGFNEWPRPGIRAQLLNTRTLELVQDFVVEGDKASTHIRPAFTGSFPFTNWMIETRLTS